MSSKKIIRFPSEQLLRPTVHVSFGMSMPKEMEIVHAYSLALQETLESFPGAAAVAANQVPARFSVIPRMFIQKVSSIDKVIINPSWTIFQSKLQEESEGCLSFPGIKVPIKRESVIYAFWRDIDGKEHNGYLTGFEARMFQHECEHLNGTTFLRNIDEKERFKIKTLMRKAKGGF